MKVREVLREKGPEVFTIGENKTIFEAANIMATNFVGSLLVLNEQGKISGILSERDILRQAAADPDTLKTAFVNSVMTQKVIVVEPDDEMEYVESVMTANKIRHLPVLNEGVLVGIVSIGDAVKSQLQVIRHDNKYMMDYIGGTTPKG